MRTPFPQSDVLLAMAMGFKQPGAIAELVFPVVNVREEKFLYYEVSLKDSLQAPDTRVGRKSTPNEMETGATELTKSTEDHALDDFVPYSDLDKAENGYNPITVAGQSVMKAIKLKQEIRVADIAFNDANYLPAQTTDVTATPFTDSATDVIAVIENAKDGMLVTPTQATMGRDVFSAIRRNPFVLKAVHRNDGDSGIASKVAIEELFEMEFIVGEAIYDQAKPGQAVNWSRVWQNHLALQHIDKTASVTEPALTHGFIAHYADVGAEIEDRKRGIKGGVTVRAGHQRTEVLASDLCGHLIKNAA